MVEPADPTPPGLSLLAIQAPRLRDVEDRRMKPWGLAIHTMGSGIVKLARQWSLPPIDAAVRFYSTPGNNFPNYVVGLQGERYQIANEQERAWHIGRFVDGPRGPRTVDRRAQYISGAWRRLAPPTVVALWDARWSSRYQHPYELFPDEEGQFPGKSPNDAYIGIELLPTTGTSAEPAAPGQRFTEAQYQAVAELAVDIGRRNDWPDGWWETSRLAGHEDISPLDRSDAGGGWDPGSLRERPYFDMAALRTLIGSASWDIEGAATNPLQRKNQSPPPKVS